MEKEIKFTIYARESSDDLNKAPPIEKQIEIGIKWGEEQGYKLIDIFKDDGFSGGDWNRPDWHRAIREAKGKHYNILWTWNQDRLARDTEQFLYFYRNLKENSIKVITMNEEINMDDVGGMAKHTSLAMASEIFRRVTSEKVSRTYENRLKEAKRKGIKVNWGRKSIQVDKDKIMYLRTTGKGYKAIAKEMNLNYQKVRRVIKELQNTPKIDIEENKINKGVQNNPIL